MWYSMIDFKPEDFGVGDKIAFAKVESTYVDIIQLEVVNTEENPWSGKQYPNEFSVLTSAETTRVMSAKMIASNYTHWQKVSDLIHDVIGDNVEEEAPKVRIRG